MHLQHAVRLCLIMITSMIVFSCDTTTTVDLPKNSPKLVLNCIGVNDKLWRAQISLSKGILEYPIFSPVSSATVNIYENEKLMETLTGGEFGGLNGSDDVIGLNYGAFVSFPTPGNTYRIEVTGEPYGQISASYQQPQSVEVESLEIRILGPNPIVSENSKNIQFQVRFADPPGENYYELLLSRTSLDWPLPITPGSLGRPHFFDPAYDENNRIFDDHNSIAFTDSYFNGTRVTLDIRSAVSPIPGEPEMNYSIFLRNVSKEYYRYLTTSLLQDATRTDPFAQPVRVENNIENGLGVFAGYTQTVKTVKFNY